MAYGIKYRHSYCNEYGVSSTVTILENGYSGAVKEIDAQEDPIVISQEGSDTNKFDTIRPSTASIGLIGSNDFKLEELFTADERKYMVENHVGGVMVWRGFVIPNGFSHEWTGGTFPMEIIASDNLSTLKDFPFLNDNGTVIKGRLNHIDILLKCLNKLDIGIDLLTLTNIVRQGGVAGEDPLFINTTDAYTFLSTDVKEEGIDFYYDNPQNAFNCEDVVNAICNIYGAKLYQSKGQWLFKRVNVDYGASISGQTFNRYNTSGVKVGTVPYDEVIVIPCTDYSGEKAQYSGARLAMSEVYKSAQSRYAYRYLTVGDKLPNIIKNTKLIGGVIIPTPPPIQWLPLDWKVTLFNIRPPFQGRTMSIQPELFPGGDFPSGTTTAIRLYGGNRNQDDALQSTPVSSIETIKEGDRFSFKFWHKTPVEDTEFGKMPFYCLVRIILKKTDSNRQWVLKNSDFLRTGVGQPYSRIHKPSWVEIDTGSLPAMSFISDFVTAKWIQEYIISQSSPADGIITIEFAGIGFPEDSIVRPPSSIVTLSRIQAFLPVHDASPGEEYTVSYIQKQARIVNAEFKLGEMEAGLLLSNNNSSGRIYTSEQNAKFTERGNQIGLSTADVQDKNLIGDILTNGTFVDKWNDSRNPYPERMPLGMLLTQDVMRQYKNVWRVIEEDIKANGLSFDTTIEFEERPGERYVIQRGSISQKFNRLIGATLIQVSANPDAPFVGTETIEEDFRTESGGGGGSGGGGSSGGSAPQDLQNVTDIGAITTVESSFDGGLRVKKLLTIPNEESSEPLAIYVRSAGTNPDPDPGYQLPIASANILGGIKVGNGLMINPTTGVLSAVVTPNDFIGYARESWVLNRLSEITAESIGAITQTNADMRYIRNQVVLQAGAKLHVEAGRFSNLLTLPSIDSTDPYAIYVKSTGTGGGDIPGYVLPIASQTVLGGIKLGDGLTIDANGVVSVTGGGGGGDAWTKSEADGRFEFKFTKNTGFNRDFGSIVNTVMQGNDTRVVQAFGWGDHAIENYFKYRGQITSGSDANNLGFDLGLRYNTTGNGSGNSNWPTTYGYMSHYSDINLGSAWWYQIYVDSNGEMVTRTKWSGVVRPDRKIWDSVNMRSDVQNDAKYVFKAGDTMTGSLTINNINYNQHLILQRGSAQVRITMGGDGSGLFIDTPVSAPTLEATSALVIPNIPSSRPFAIYVRST